MDDGTKNQRNVCMFVPDGLLVGSLVNQAALNAVPRCRPGPGAGAGGGKWRFSNVRNSIAWCSCLSKWLQLGATRTLKFRRNSGAPTPLNLTSVVNTPRNYNSDISSQAECLARRAPR